MFKSLFKQLFFVLRIAAAWALVVMLAAGLYSSIPLLGQWEFPMVLAGMATMALVVTGAINGDSLHGLVTVWAKGKAEDRSQVEVELWNSHSRVQVSKLGRMQASLWGPGRKCSAPLVRQRTGRVGQHAQPVDQPTGQIAVAERRPHGQRRQRARPVGQPLGRGLAGDDVQAALAR